MIPLTTSNPLKAQVDALDEKAMTSTAQDILASHNEPVEEETAKPSVDPKVKKRNDEFRQRVDVCKNYRRKLITNWSVSIDYRRGKPFISQTDEDQISVNLDWTYTKAKQAALFSQIPQVRLNHAPETLPKVLPWIPNFERTLNDRLIEAGIESAMDECIPDCINAAGIGVVMVSYECITEDRQVPSIDFASLPPELHTEALQSGTIGGNPVPMETVPVPVDHRYQTSRLSPGDLLWPLPFIGSNFNNSPWIGRSGRITWADAVIRFGLKEEDKEKVLGEERPMLDRLTHDSERDKPQADEMVSFDELFYKEFQFDEGVKSFSTIHHLVFVTGKTDPVVDEPWKGQKLDEQSGALLGATKYPIQVLTLDYLTDEPIPPSCSAIGRPQVNEINKGRSHQNRQRERSLPVRWFDVNRVDPSIQQGIMRGTWQAMIPVQGDGNRIIGEVARATMPAENFAFDKVARTDLQQQFGVPGQNTEELDNAKNDPNQNLSGFNTQSGRERAKVGAFFCAIAEVLGGLMCLYEDPSIFGEGFNAAFSKALKFAILTDSTVLLDAGQKLARLNQFMNTYGKSGWVNLEPVLQEIATLVGLDASLVVKAPEPKPPVEPNISLRLTGVEDMLNPLTLAIMIKSGQAPTPELIEQAKQLIQQAVVPPSSPGMIDPATGAPQMAPPQAGPPPGSPMPQPAPPAVGEAHPNMTAMPTIDKRSESGGKQ